MNQLYPIFLKTEKIHILLIGGGFVATEKLQFLLKSSPQSNIRVVAENFSDNFKKVIQNHTSNTQIIQRAFLEKDLEDTDLVICAIDNPKTSEKIYTLAKKKHILINVADKPQLCDFYLGAIVTKGDLKIAISTNGKSPTLAKKMRQFFEDIIPNDIETLIQNLYHYKNTLKLDLEEKIKHLNEITNIFGKDK